MCWKQLAFLFKNIPKYFNKISRFSITIFNSVLRNIDVCGLVIYSLRNAKRKLPLVDFWSLQIYIHSSATSFVGTNISYRLYIAIESSAANVRGIFQSKSNKNALLCKIVANTLTIFITTIYDYLVNYVSCWSFSLGPDKDKKHPTRLRFCWFPMQPLLKHAIEKQPVSLLTMCRTGVVTTGHRAVWTTSF